jgi:hypothetical protein
LLICTAQNPKYSEGWCVAVDMISKIEINDLFDPSLRITIKREYYGISPDNWGRINSNFLEKTGLNSGLVDVAIEYPELYDGWSF